MDEFENLIKCTDKDIKAMEPKEILAFSLRGANIAIQTGAPIIETVVASVSLEAAKRVVCIVKNNS